jgi:glucose-1-phosphate thymidylyltransferase
MKIIVPMAGRGSRLRPHSLTTPKPLISVAGAPIVHQLVHEIAKVVESPITDIGFVIGDPAFFGDEVETSLKELALSLGAKPHIFRQDQPLGTGHAIMSAAPLLEGPTVVAYADTLIRAKLNLDPSADAVIWVKQVEDPAAFGVVELNSANEIVNLVEKPKKFVSDLAAIGIYYFKAIEQLKEALTKVVSQELKKGQEYQINQGILLLIEQGAIVKPGEVDVWMDCGNPQITLQTNTEMLSIKEAEGAMLQEASAVLNNSTIISPCFIGKNVTITNSTVGPGVSVGPGTKIENCQLKHSLIGNNCSLENLNLEQAMIGNEVRYRGNPTFVSIGDYSQLE